MFSMTNPALTLHCRPALVVLQLWTRYHHSPVRSGHGGWSRMTLNVQLLVLPEVSSAVQVTVLLPRPNVEPDGGEQVVEATPQLSLATGSLKVTTALVTSSPTLVMMFAGQVIVGGCVSLTVTLKVQTVTPLVVTVTVVVPVLKNEPLGGRATRDGQASLPQALKVTVAPHRPGAVLVVMSDGRWIVQPWSGWTSNAPMSL